MLPFWSTIPTVKANVSLQEMTMRSVRQLGSGLLGVAALVAATVVHADTGPLLVRLGVIDFDSGTAKPEHRHAGRSFVVAETGSRYLLRLDNVSAERVLVVLSVDGVNAVSGETAATGQRGYILGPHEATTIRGWRKSLAEVAAFRFAALPNSYAARTGRPADVGVIGVAVFRERAAPPIATNAADAVAGQTRYAPPQMPFPAAPAPITTQSVTAPPPPPPPPPAPNSAAPAAPIAPLARSAPVTTAKLGTAHGEIEPDVLTIVDFQRASPVPASIRQIEYDSAGNLVAAGVLPANWPSDGHPRPFPGNAAPGFVPDPPPAPAPGY